MAIWVWIASKQKCMMYLENISLYCFYIIKVMIMGAGDVKESFISV